jgi:hypothetical protein
MVPYEKLSQDRQHDVGDFQEWDHRLGLLKKPGRSFLVGGFKHFLFSITYGMSSFPLTFIFFKRVKATNQIHILFRKVEATSQGRRHQDIISSSNAWLKKTA